MKKNVLPPCLEYKGTDGKYTNDAQAVADYFGVHRNAVYNSRNRGAKPEKFDKLYAYHKTVAACKAGELVFRVVKKES